MRAGGANSGRDLSVGDGRSCDQRDLDATSSRLVQDEGWMGKGPELSKLRELREGWLEPVLNLLNPRGARRSRQGSRSTYVPKGAERSEPPRRLLP